MYDTVLSIVVSIITKIVMQCVTTLFPPEPPSKPTNLRNTSNTVNSISIAWSSPDFLGERDDLYYTVEYSDPDKVGKMIMAIECMTSTSFTVTGLQPATDYVIRVMARNGVSDQDVGGGLSRMKEIFCRTELARKLNINYE